jgi:uncharacterized protein (DUF58 family)
MLTKILLDSCQSFGKALNHDFCPSANSYVYWLKQPIGWVLCGTAASLLVGLFVGPQGYVLTAAFLTLLVLGVSWPWLSMKGLSCELKFDESRSVEGEPTIISLDIVNRLPIPAFGLMIQGQFLQDLNHEDDIIAVGLKRAAGWSVSNFKWSLAPKRRGQLPTECPLLVTGFPFGLYQISKPVKVVGSTIVWPQCSDVETLTETVGKQFAINASASRQAGNDGDTIGVRDYRYGDSIRNIHWSHTARHNRLIIREKQSLTQTPIRVVLDLTRGQHSGAGSQSTYEKSIRLAASVCRELHRHQSQIELICVGLAKNMLFKTNNHRGIKPLIDFLALLPQFDNESAFASDATRASIENGHAFTFLVHTDQFVPETDPSKVRCFCVDSNPSQELNHEQAAELPPSSLPVGLSPLVKDDFINGMGASHVTT